MKAIIFSLCVVFLGFACTPEPKAQGWQPRQAKPLKKGYNNDRDC